MTQRHRKGFTLVELMLSIAFISGLLLAIALLAIQVSHIYQRGTTLREINQTGRELSDLLRRDFLQARAKDIDDSQARIAHGTHILGGRLCLGGYSYIWNTADALQGDTAVHGVDVAKMNGKPISLVRVADGTKKYCQLTGSGYPAPAASDNPVHVLRQKTGDETVLAIYDMKVKRIAAPADTLQSEALYEVQFTIGTSKKNEIDTSLGSCKPPHGDDEDANFEFCAINKFRMIVRTNG